ncbi:hypothetical protein HUK80_12715 [Flavobacterium sp. MAH-1]|uniref:MG2 domain-containing protein n=1 Tax=Flavobacterium agri TaxID=2743471 RepID=A0A7Y8Y3F4_9FLAO|nr:hypothetical protein [Flavobacterium agri]NUY81763.1 hypothetical protein [Flavobacterium agri]NYA71787.1 hypothetical protein [Flavobacterium agri]
MSPDLNKESIAISEYFKSDREGIHLHVNKAAYLSGEQIWFKGYVIKKQSALPYPETMNVYVTLIDSKGQKVNSALLYCENSLFNGFLKVPENLESGVYYLQTYTYFMNNFAEDESSVYPITVLKKDSNDFFDPNAIDFDSLSITFFPESGVFLAGNANTMAMRIADCSGNGVPGIEGAVFDSKATQIAVVSTDASGYARFDINDTNMGPYRLKATINNKEYEQTLPTPSVTGINFSINNYVFADKATLTLKTNKATLEKIKGRKYDIVIQQFGSSTTATFSFDDNQTKQNLSIPSINFSDGLNTVYLVDPGAGVVAERMVYKAHRSSSAKTELSILQKRGDSIVVGATSSMKLASLSVSVVPTESVMAKNDMFGKLELAGLKNNEKINGRYYFEGFNRKKHFELDNMLMAQTPKYAWKNIILDAPVSKYPFDKGLTLKGTVNNKNINRATSKVNLNAMAYGLNEFSSIDDKNEFVFDQLMIQDSSNVFISLFEKKDQRTDIKLAAQLSGNNRPFIKSFEPVAKTCILKPIEWKYGFPEIRDAIKLDSVLVKGANKPKMNKERARYYSNSVGKGYKINDQDVNMYPTVVEFIQNHGYNVTQNAGRVIITRTYSTSFNAPNSPQVYIDDMIMDDHSLLTTYRMDMVDEIYINKHGYGSGLAGANGSIRIYLKKGAYNSRVKVLSKSILIKDAFQLQKEYKNPDYADTKSDAFHSLGALHWIPEQPTDAQGKFRFAFPNLRQDTVKIVIEGIASDGTLISEEQILKIN